VNTKDFFTMNNMKNMSKLLSNGSSNAKTKKNQRPTKILYLHPSKIEGKEMCPFASEGCRMSCLNTAGRGAMQSVQDARIRRTKQYVLNRVEFFDKIQKEINGFAKWHKREVAVRLNGTSDQPLVESIIVAQMRHIEPNVVFYDYTKNHKKAGIRLLPSGHTYVVAFSYSEKEGSESQALDVLEGGGISAIVFDELPKTWHGYPVVNGDERDDLMVDIEGPAVLGLVAKGKAKHDTSGFVVKKTADHMHVPKPVTVSRTEDIFWNEMAAYQERFAD